MSEGCTLEENESLLKDSLLLKNITKFLPSNFKFSCSSSESKIYFTASSNSDGGRSNLYCIDLFSIEKEIWDSKKFSDLWQLIVSSDQLEWEQYEMSKENELLRERKRLTSSGITDYWVDPRAHRILIPSASGSVFFLVETNTRKVNLFPKDNLPSKDASRMDPKWSSDGCFFAFVKRRNLWLGDPTTGIEYPITESINDDISCGLSEFIIQEEFDRYTGYWWCPSVEKVPIDQGNSILFVYRIFYVEVDESPVAVYQLAEYDRKGNVESFKYPLVGEANAKSSLCLAEIHVVQNASEGPLNITVIRKRLFPSLYTQFPWFEYLLRCGWMPSGKRVWVQLMDRKQQRLSLVSFSLESFLSESSEVSMIIKPMILLEEHSEIWINVHDTLHFLDDEHFLWCSERSGYRHLYFIETGNNQWRPITEGNWQIDADSPIEVDREQSVVYFTGTYDTPLETHLYGASFKDGIGPNAIHRLTLPHYHHVVTISASSKGLFLSRFSNVRESPRVALFSIPRWDLQPLRSPCDTPGDLLAYIGPVDDVSRLSLPSRLPIRSPEIFSFINSIGISIYGAIYLPEHLSPDQKCPTILQIYGGPHVQLVLNDYESLMVRYAKYQLYAHLGFAVVIIDGIGSNRRGLAFEAHLQHRMGTVELRDQVEGLLYVAQHYGCIDLGRVAITGWSYGGYLSLMALGQHSELFKVVFFCFFS